MLNRMDDTENNIEKPSNFTNVVDDNDVEGILKELRPGLELLFASDFAGLKKMFKRRPGSFYHVFCLALLRTALAAMTLDKSKFKIAMETAWKGIEVSDRMRKKNAGLLFRCDPNEYTDEECHAELVSSELQALFGGLCVVEDQSIFGFIKGAFRIKSCYNGLKECERIAAGKTNWRSQDLKEEFVAGVNLGLGLFEMGISFMPRKFMILLELVGFSSNRSFGLEKLKTCASFSSSVRKYGGMISLSGYYLFIEYFYGLGDLSTETIDMLKDIMHHGLSLFPNSEYAIGVKGGLAYISGNFKEAEFLWDQFIYQTLTPRGLKYILFYYKVWLSTLMGNWNDALNSARILKEECKWSRSLFCYMYAVYASLVLRAESGFKENSSLRDSMIQALMDVPRVKRHFGGKKAFHERIVIEKSQEFLSDPESKMILPHLDLMYLWNLFSIASMNRECIKLIGESIDEELKKIKRDENHSFDLNLETYLKFMRGVVHSATQELESARDCFLVVINREDKSLKIDKHLVPQAYFELGMMYRKTHDFEEARKFFRKCQKYTGYLTEAMISFRTDCALKSMSDQEQQKQTVKLLIH